MTEPYSTCGECVVRDWCKRRSGETPLPEDYSINPECSGFVMLEQAIKLSGIPLEFRVANKRNYVFDHDNIGYKADLETTFDNIVNMVSKGVNIALIHPHKGTGKTRTACTLGNEFIYKAVNDPEWFDYETPLALYMKYGQWANGLRQMYQIDDKEFNLKVLKDTERMKQAPLLIIDDIGSGRITPYIRDLTYDIIDYRKEHVKSTIFTSNIPIDTLATSDYLGDIIVSRLMFNTVLYEMGGRDRRADETY